MLQVEGVVASYGQGAVLQGVHLVVPQGRLVCLMGRNGVGKTTLLKTLMGLIPVEAGRILFFGEDITRTAPDQRARRGLGYVPQGRGIFPHLTVRENLLLGLESRPGRLRPAEIQAQLEEQLQLFPMLRRVLHRPGGTLSGGQQQQLAIARALMGRPRCLLLDELLVRIEMCTSVVILKCTRVLGREGAWVLPGGGGALGGRVLHRGPSFLGSDLAALA